MGGKICHHSQRVVGPQATIQTAWAGGPASRAPAVPFVCPTTTPPLRPQMVAEHMQLVLSALCSSHTRLSSGPPLSADQSPEDWSRLSSCTPRHPTSRGAEGNQRGSAEQQSVALQQREQQAAGAVVPISNLWRSDHAFAELFRVAVASAVLALQSKSIKLDKIEGTVGYRTGCTVEGRGFDIQREGVLAVLGSELVRVLLAAAARRRGRVGRAPGSSPPG